MTIAEGFCYKALPAADLRVSCSFSQSYPPNISIEQRLYLAEAGTLRQSSSLRRVLASVVANYENYNSAGDSAGTGSSSSLIRSLLNTEFPYLSVCPKAFVSAKTVSMNAIFFIVCCVVEYVYMAGNLRRLAIAGHSYN